MGEYAKHCKVVAADDGMLMASEVVITERMFLSAVA